MVTLDLNKVGRIDAELVKGISAEMVPPIMPDDQPTDNVYHYTSIDGLKAILENRRLRFTHISYMNDREEVIAGAEQFRKMGLARCDNELASILATEAQNIEEGEPQVYVCCFSLKQDDLAMWNYYTKNPQSQGYNIAFDYRELVIGILRANPELHGCKFYFGLVDYRNDEGYASEVYRQSVWGLKNAMSSLVDAIRKLVPAKGAEEKSMKEVLAEEEVCVPVVKYYGDKPEFKKQPSLSAIYFMKRPCFASEVEFRIVIEVTQEALEKLKTAKWKKYQFRSANGALIPYLELDFDLNSMKGIKLSPTITSDLAAKGVREYCSYCGISPDNLADGITQSEIPVRF